MKLFQQTFLFVVGIITIAFDEIAESIDEAIKSVEEQREKLGEQFAKNEA